VTARKQNADLRIRAGFASDVGRVRRENEDTCLVSLEQNLFIVSDGMGGHQAGEIASKAVVTALPQILKQRLSPKRPAQTGDIELVLRDAIVELSRQLRIQSAGQASLRGMGATVAMVWVRGASVHLAHMGDSRIYLFRRPMLKQLTEDHSVIALLVKHGDITQAQAKDHPMRARLSRHVGMEGEIYPDVQTVRIQNGDRLLLCSDGLTGMVPEDRIAKILQDNIEPDAACKALVAAANAAGGTDNITAVVLNVENRDPNRRASRPGA